jgi:hypothetical protein
VPSRASLRIVLILLPLATTATTLHAHRLAPDLATQEMNRCLKLVRIVASRRKSRGGSNDRTAGSMPSGPRATRSSRECLRDRVARRTSLR